MTAMLAMSEHKGGRVPVILHPGAGQIEDWGKIYSEDAQEKTIPVISAWQINERMYGALQGKNKEKCREKYGADQVKLWRRSYDIAPPQGECLKDTADRAIPYFKEKILPYLNAGKNVLVSAHGNSLRAIVMLLDSLSKEEVLSLEIGTGVPIIYDFQNGSWKKEE